jgi:shikimate O-hydroxycinnamoyltransferase
MAKALVAFYPLAGRLGFDNDGRLEISCNGEGVRFVVARSSLVAEDFDFSKPSLELRRVFVPRIEPPSLIMAIQVRTRNSSININLSFNYLQARIHWVTPYISKST